jgi:hypothetical protein
MLTAWSRLFASGMRLEECQISSENCCA